MVIDQFHVKSVVIMPDKTYTPLVINADAVLPFSIAFQSFQPVSGRNTEIKQAGSVVKQLELPKCHACNFRRKIRTAETIENLLRALIRKRFNHMHKVTRKAYNCNYYVYSGVFFME